MKHYFSQLIASTFICLSPLLTASTLTNEASATMNSQDKIPHRDNPKIQAAILLDVSNSMDGLIEQAKAQLWNMVSVMGRARCDGRTPQIEIALYEYGRTTNNPRDGYVKKLSGFTSDLDGLSQTLFNLTTDGGDEFCGHVMFNSLRDLNWDTCSTNYKVIFIAGNEDFLQGDILWTKACNEASRKGVIVNTIYCGDKSQGIREHWNLAGECGKGSFTTINQDAKIDDIATPYDDRLFQLNESLNKTYIAYGSAGQFKAEQQSMVDSKNYELNKSVAAKRIAVKGQKDLYKNNSWDLVDASADDSSFIAKVDLKTLPASLQGKSRAELKAIIRDKNAQRTKIQKEITGLSTKRDAFIAQEKVKKAGANSVSTLEGEIEKIVKQQAMRFKMIIQ